MSMRALYIGFGSPVWVEIASSLQASMDLNPIYWSAHAGMQPLVRQAFPDVVFHERFQAARGVAPAEHAHLDPWPLDQALLQSLAPLESTVLQMMERMDGGRTFLYGDRVALYHQLVRYWHSMLIQEKPSLLLFLSSPHFVYDFIAYYLAGVLGIRRLIFRHTSLPQLSYVGESIEAGSSGLRAAYRSAVESSDETPVLLTPENEQYLSRLDNVYEGVEPDYMRRQRAATSRRVTTALFRHPRAAVGSALAGSKRVSHALVHRARAQTIVKSRNRPVEEAPSIFEYATLKLGAMAKLRRLKRTYDALASAPDLSVPYVFLALHFQPERTTSPEAGVFARQELIVSQLARHLPQGWRLYVKEHPTQFISENLFDSVGAQQRPDGFYRSISGHANVQLIPLDTNPFSLIDGARAVATATGTIGWEAVWRGRPVLTFGYPWYLGCEGVFQTMNDNDLQRAMASVHRGVVVERKRVRQFVRTLEQCGFLRRPIEDVDDESKRDARTDTQIIDSWSRAIERHLAHGPTSGDTLRNGLH